MFFIYESVINSYKKASKIRYEQLCRGRQPLSQVIQPIKNRKNRDSIKNQQINKQPKPLPTQLTIIKQKNLLAEQNEQKYKSINQVPSIKIYSEDKEPKTHVSNQSQSQKPAIIKQKPLPKASIIKQSELLKQNNKQQILVKNIDQKPIKPGKDINIKESSQPTQNVKLYECLQGCGRSFNEKALQKHSKICKKVFQQKRKQFSAAEQRQIQEAKNVSDTFKKKKNQQQKETSKPKWKQQSLVFRANIKKTKNIPLTQEQQQALKQPSPDLVQCNFCNRRFNKNAAQKHIPFCEKKSKKK